MVVKKIGKSKEERTMKKMMTNMKTLVALLMAGAAVTSCSSDNELDSPKAPAVKTYTMTVQATKGGDATTRALTDAGSTLTATWATTENVYVKKVDTWANGSLKPQADGATATLKGTLSDVAIAATDVLTLQFPRSGALDYTGQVGTLEDIAAKYDYATATVTVKSVSGGDIIPEAATTTFQHQQAIVKFTLVDKANTSTKLSPTALTINDGTSDIVTLTGIPGATYTTNGEGVLYVALPAVSSKPITLTATVGSDTYTLTTSSSKTFNIGNFYRVTAKMTKQAAVPTGALSGQFTVGMDGSTPIKVYFSKGNLQAKIDSYSSDVATASEWKFADSQYSTIGNAAGNTTFVAGTWVDLFSWVGNSATYDTYGLIIFTSSSQANHGIVSGESLKTDWGTAAASSIGTGWYTLSKDEWVYLFNMRTVNNGTGSGKSYTLGQKVNDVLGVVLYPDDYTGAAYTTGSDWATFESAGCVFLPAAGLRKGTEVSRVDEYGRYWSSTANGTGDAYCAGFNSDEVRPAYSNYRDRGFSVRLVRDVPSN